MQNHLLDRLDTLLKQRVASFHFTMKIIVISLLISGCIIYFLVVCFYRNFIDSMSQLRQAVASITSGDLSTSLVNNGTDEVALTIHEVQLMQQNLSILVANVRSNSSMVSNLGQQLASGISDMSIRTEQQASSLEQTSASVDDLAETVKNNADSAESVNNLASNVRLIAESSGDTMRAAVDSMQGIQSSALKVQEIVSMIDTIAFQTDILALNAAVEASHAGEQGRGFAVVATEVRSLAQRSADAARRIRRLIDESVTRVEAGVEQIHEVNLTLADIVGGIQHLATNINAISTASAEQSNGLAQISQAIRDLDQITQSNGKMADEAQHVSSNLEQRAGDLTHSVASFKLLQGTADEAYAMVKKAVNLFKINGLPTLQRITEDADKVFADRDMYVFAFDRQGQYLAFGGNPAKLEVNLLKVNGLDGEKLVADAFALVSGGWVDYTIVNPLTLKIDAKTSYIERVTEDIVIGCGVYKNQAQ